EGHLAGVVAVSATDVWAVGEGVPLHHDTGPQELPLIEHWDGTRWAIVPGPAAVTAGELYGVAATAPNGVWAVGGGVGNYGTTLAEHWDGTRWRVIPSVSDPQIESVFSAVTAASLSDVWAVGYIGDTSHTSIKLMEHWDGTAWRIVRDATDPVDYPTMLT